MAERDVGVELFKQAEQRAAAGDTAVAARLASRARDVLMDAQDPDSACAAASLEAHIHMRSGDLASANAAIDWALAEAEQRGLISRQLSALSDKGALLEMVGDLSAAVAAHRQVLDVQRTIDNPLGVAAATGNVGRLLTRLLRADEASALLDESLRLYREADNEPGVINALICIGDLERGRGELQAAEAAFGQAIDRCTDGRFAPLRAVALLNYGHILRDRGRAEEAIEAFGDSRVLSTHVGDLRGVARARLAEAMALADSQTPARSLEAFTEAEQAFLTIGQPAGALAATVNRSAVLCRVGRLTEGRDGLAHARTLLLRMGDEQAALEVGLALAEVEIALGRIGAAEGLVAELDAAAGGPRLALRKGLISARLSLRAGLLADARDQLERSLVPEASLGERFACDLFGVELAILSGDPRAAEGLAALLETADPTDQPREYAAARGTNGQFELWRGDLALAEASYAEAVGRWEALGERLAVLQSSGGLWRARALAGRPPAAEEVQAAADELRELGAADMAASMGTLARSLAAARDVGAGGDPSLGAAAVAEAVFELLRSGNRVAAIIELATAATLTGSAALEAEVRTLLDATDLCPPCWMSGDRQPGAPNTK